MRSRDRDFQNEWEIFNLFGSSDGRTAEGWSREVTEDIAAALLERDASEGDPSESAKTFVRAY